MIITKFLVNLEKQKEILEYLMSNELLKRIFSSIVLIPIIFFNN